ncbi:MAG TPA: hypothetical protein VG943_10925 [Caulobacterales bacterium]|nr:hypothetical protein [Caulobacterales bacterium]
MRLLDRVARLQSPFVVEFLNHQLEIPRAALLSAAVMQSYLRYVLADDVTSLCGQIALHSTDFLLAAIDLVRLPASVIWIEWNDAPYRRMLIDLGVIDPTETHERKRTGMCVFNDADGRRGRIVSCWEFPEARERIEINPFELQFDLDRGDYRESAERTRQQTGLWTPKAAQLSDVLGHARFELDAPYAPLLKRYATAERFHSVCGPAVARGAFDFPLAWAFLLMLAAPNALNIAASDLSRLNASRRRQKKTDLLSHLEVRSVIGAHLERERAHGFGGERAAPRMHFVRGHLVRRKDKIFWRNGHVRGRPEKGAIYSRTAVLRLQEVAGPPKKSAVKRTLLKKAPSDQNDPE